MDITLEKFIKTAVLYFLDSAENTAVEDRLLQDYKASKGASVLARLAEANMASPRILALLDAISETIDLECKCGSKEFNVDCPMAVCLKCHSEFYIDTNNTNAYCKICEGYKVGNCQAKEYILAKDQKHERNTNS